MSWHKSFNRLYLSRTANILHPTAPAPNMIIFCLSAVRLHFYSIQWLSPSFINSVQQVVSVDSSFCIFGESMRTTIVYPTNILNKKRAMNILHNCGSFASIVAASYIFIWVGCVIAPMWTASRSECRWPPNHKLNHFKIINQHISSIQCPKMVLLVLKVRTKQCRRYQQSLFSMRPLIGRRIDFSVKICSFGTLSWCVRANRLPVYIDKWVQM